MFRSCQNCQQSFEIMDEDLKFYKEISPIFNNKKYLEIIYPPEGEKLVIRNCARNN